MYDNLYFLFPLLQIASMPYVPSSQSLFSQMSSSQASLPSYHYSKFPTQLTQAPSYDTRPSLSPYDGKFPNYDGKFHSSLDGKLTGSFDTKFPSFNGKLPTSALDTKLSNPFDGKLPSPYDSKLHPTYGSYPDVSYPGSGYCHLDLGLSAAAAQRLAAAIQ